MSWDAQLAKLKASIAAPTAAGSDGGGDAPKTPFDIVFRYDDMEIENKLGEGGFACVFDARHRPSNRRFAAKVFALKRIKKEKAVSISIERERAAFGALRERQRRDAADNNPFYVISMYAFLEHAKQGTIVVMEQCLSAAVVDVLHDKIRNGDNRREAARVYSAQLVHAVSYLHSCGVVHRDLKPLNILFACVSSAPQSNNFSIRLIDLGAAKAVCAASDTGDARRRQRCNSLIGSPSYMPPELLPAADKQKKNKPEFNGSMSFEGDLWALGCTVYTMYTRIDLFGDKKKTRFDCWNAIRENAWSVSPETLKDAFDNDTEHAALQLCRALLKSDESERLGAADANGELLELKKHKLFDGLDFSNLNKSIPAFMKDVLSSL